MKPQKPTPEQTFVTLKKKSRALVIAECFSALAAIIGTIASGVTGQVAFAATPLTLSAILNIFSRRQLDQLFRQTNVLDMIEIQREVTASIQGIRAGRLGVMAADAEGMDSMDLQSSLSSLAERVLQVESYLELQGSGYFSSGGSLADEVANLRNHQLELSNSLETMNLAMQGQGQDVSVHSSIPDELERLTQAIQALEDRSALLETGVAPSSPDMQAWVQPLQEQLAFLEARLDERATAEPGAVPQNPEALHADFANLIQPLQSQVSALEEQLKAQPMPAQESNHYVQDTAHHDHLNQQIENLSHKLENSLTQIFGEISGFQGVLQASHEEINAMRLRLAEVQHQTSEAMASMDANALYNHVESGNQALRDQISTLHARVESTPTVDVHQELQQSLAPLYERIAHLDEQIQRSNNGEQNQSLLNALSGVQSQIQGLETRLNELGHQGPAQTEQLNALQNHYQEVQASLNTLGDLQQQVNELSGLPGQMQSVSELSARLDALSYQVTTDLNRIPMLIDEKIRPHLDQLQVTPAPPPPSTSSQLDDLLKELNF
jgi:chromosome segregation ATPase